MLIRTTSILSVIACCGAIILTLLEIVSNEPCSAATMQQLISREDPTFNATASRLNVGKDGNIYLSNAASGTAYVMRIGRDGSGKFGSQVIYAISNATAYAAGIVATGNQHFNHSINIYNQNLTKTGTVNDFLNNDTVGYDAPAHVDTGDSGDFYGLDQHRNRVVRVSTDAKIVTTYPVRADGEPVWAAQGDFRVCEKTQSFYWIARQTIRCVGFDGKTKWTVPASVGGNPWDGYYGGFDIDPSGNLYTITGTDQSVLTYTPDGKPSGKIALQMGDSAPSPGSRITDLQVFGNDIIVKRFDPVELFSVYDRATGAKRRVVDAAVERLTVDYPGDIWVAGQPAPLTIKLDTGPQTISPQWHVWLRPFNTPVYRELPLSNGSVTTPVGAGGLYQLKVSAGVGGSSSEYLVQTIIEVRAPGAKGSATVTTPTGRMYYGRGETIPVTVELRALQADTPKRITVSLVDAGGTIAVSDIPVIGADKPVTLTLDKQLTDRLAPGTYQLVADVPGFTCAAQPIVIGQGMEAASPFRNIVFGDYGPTFPSAGYWDTPETVSRNLTRMTKLGKNMFADRLGSGLGGAVQWQNSADGAVGLAALADRLRKSPISVAPDKTQIESTYMQTLAGYSAHSMREMAILMGMDAGLPIGTLYDPRKPEVVKPLITDITKKLLSYPAFAGWDWAANWWPSKFGADAATSPDQKSAYNVALKTALDTGKWNPVLDDVSDVWMNYIPNATADFDATLKAVAPDKLSDDPGPYWSVDVYPPVSFKNADEVDLHYQSEQIQPPLVMPHDVDFQKRPGKPAWAHPELWNDNGTGDQILPTSFELMMRGADGVGESGIIPYMAKQPEDPRQTYFGVTSTYRALGRITNDYGPWLTTLRKADSVAIICSPRMFRIDNWGGVGGKHFTRLYEAYQCCLYAHRPASFVFLDDMNPDTLMSYKTLLLVDQEVEMEPLLKTYIDKARATGVTVFYDGTCRPELMAGYTKLGYSFNKVDADPNVWQDDSAATLALRAIFMMAPRGHFRRRLRNRRPWSGDNRQGRCPNERACFRRGPLPVRSQQHAAASRPGCDVAHGQLHHNKTTHCRQPSPGNGEQGDLRHVWIQGSQRFRQYSCGLANCPWPDLRYPSTTDFESRSTRTQVISPRSGPGLGRVHSGTQWLPHQRRDSNPSEADRGQWTSP